MFAGTVLWAEDDLARLHYGKDSSLVDVEERQHRRENDNALDNDDDDDD